MFRLLFPVCIALSCCTARAEIKSENPTYEGGGVTMKGYLAYDADDPAPRPGILVVHEWWGHNEYARKRAIMLARMGYTALAVDLYGDGKNTTHPDQASKFSSAVMQNMPRARERFEAALKILKDHPSTNPAKMAAIGYCFGGGVVLHMARLGVDLKGVASFHGSLATSHPAKPGVVKARILVCHGADDSFIAPDHITAFKKEMKEAGASMKFIAYQGAVHSFTNPEADAIAKKSGLPIAYHAKADQASWRDLSAFLENIFSNK